MPIYEYKCPSCGQSFEKIVSISGGQETPPCPHCGSEQTERMMSAFATTGGDGDGLDFGSGGGCSPTGGFT